MHFCTPITSYLKRKIIPFVIASKIIKYFRINVSKEMKDLYTKKNKTLMKGIKANTNKC